MHDEAGLIEKLRKIEALFARPGTDGERRAAADARDRILERLRRLEKSEQPVEYRLSLADTWSRSLFIALARRYGLSPYRLYGQRRTTVMLRVTRTFMDETLWPEFEEADRVLRQYLQEVTERVIASAISGDITDLEERPPDGGGGAQASARHR
jgi:hypothetical protein